MTEEIQGSSPIEETREDLLREAQRLLDVPGREKAHEDLGPPRSILVFSLGSEWYSVDLAHVKKVLRPSPLAYVPGAPPEVLGLMNCHGEVLCVLDLRKILGIPAAAKSASAHGAFVVVMHFGGKDAGVLVDSVDDVWEIPAVEILPPLETLEPSRARFFEGTISRGNRFVGLLSASMCLNP
jgi:purine-binding chemotaxis protein CheW